MMRPKRNRNESMHYFIVVLTVFMILGVLTRVFIRRNKLNIPHNLFVLGFSIIAGATIACVKNFRDAWFDLKMAPQFAVGAYLPVFIMYTMYNMDHQLFKRYILQSVIVTLSTALITPIVISASFIFVLYPEWSYTHGLMISMIILPLEPRHVVELFQVLSNHKFLATMLQIESVLIQVFTPLGNNLVGNYRSGLVDKWYQFFAIIAREIIGGFIIGLLIALVHMRLILFVYQEPLNAVSISLIMVYITYFVSTHLAFVNGSFALICMCSYIIMNKHKLPVEVDNSLQVFWNTLFNLVETPMLMFAMTEVTLYAVLLFEYATMYGAIFLYVVGVLDRLRACIMLTPILNRMSYNVNAKCLFVLGWSGIKGASNLYYLLTLVGFQHLTESMQSFLLGSMGYVVLSNLINCSTMRVLLKMSGLYNITMTRLANMYNYMRYLRQRQMCMMEVLKANRYLSNTNWALVRKESFVYQVYLDRASTYHKAMLYNEEHNYQFNDRLLTCPDCHKEFRNELSDKEKEDMLKKTLLQIFKSQKVAIIKQYESGVMNKNVLQILAHHLDTKIESNNRRKDATINLDQFNPKGRSLNIIIKILTFISRHQTYKVPTNHFRRLVYFLVLHYMYEIVLFVIIIGNAIFSLWNADKCCQSNMYWYHFAITFIFAADYAMKVTAVGIYVTFSEYWTIIDKILLFLDYINLFITRQSNVFNWFIYYIPSFRLISALRLITGFRLLGTYSPRIITYIDYVVDSNIALRFDLASAWLSSIEEVLSGLPQIAPEKFARVYYENNLNEERKRLLDEMAAVQKTRPWIAVTVKTKQAICTTLFAMDMNLKEMQRAGYTDAIESAAILKLLREPQQFLMNMKFVKPNAIRSIFKDVPWMPNDNAEVMEYLYENTEEVSKDAKETIMQIDTLAEGVYVVVTGMLVLTFQSLTRASRYEGYLPVVDYLATTDYNSVYNKVVVSGSTVGEVGVLTGRRYDCTIYAGTPSEGYWLPAQVIRTAMFMCSNPVTGMEAMMWRHCSENLAIAVIMQSSQYRSSTREEIKNKLKNAFMPILRAYMTFIRIDYLIDNIILINGCVMDTDTGEVYIAPYLIPKIVETMTLMHNPELNIEVHLMVIPCEGVTAVEVMTEEEEAADLLPQRNSREVLRTKHERKKTKLHATASTI